MRVCFWTKSLYNKVRRDFAILILLQKKFEKPDGDGAPSRSSSGSIK